MSLQLTKDDEIFTQRHKAHKGQRELFFIKPFSVY